MQRKYPTAPIVAVGIIIRDGERIVLIRRNQEPSRGLWTFPGGAVELGEQILDAVRREALEETGLIVQVEEVAAVVDHVVRGDEGRIVYHYVIVDYLARPTGGELWAGSDVSDARWVRLADLDGLKMTEKAGEIARVLLAAGSRR